MAFFLPRTAVLYMSGDAGRGEMSPEEARSVVRVLGVVCILLGRCLVECGVRRAFSKLLRVLVGDGLWGSEVFLIVLAGWKLTRDVKLILKIR